jgi:hypothetical protein
VEIRLRDYSATPGGRTVAHGAWPANVWREVVLAPVLETARRRGELLIVDLDGTTGIAHCFLDEAFGGLVRVNGLDVWTVLGLVVVRALREPYLADDVYDCVMRAANGGSNAIPRQA